MNVDVGVKLFLKYLKSEFEHGVPRKRAMWEDFDHDVEMGEDSQTCCWWRKECEQKDDCSDMVASEEYGNVNCPSCWVHLSDSF